MSETYVTSKDYEVYWTLKQSGFPVLGRMVGRGERQFSNYGGSAPEERKEEIIEACQWGAFEFIDPSSQQKTPKEQVAPEMLKELERHCAICMMMHPDCEACEFCGTRKVLKKARGEE